eukprot:4158400-Pleurochrysis_carterae.AAC.1
MLSKARFLGTAGVLSPPRATVGCARGGPWPSRCSSAPCRPLRPPPPPGGSASPGRRGSACVRPGGGGSCWRMRVFSVCASWPPETSGAMSHPASRERSSFIANTYAQIMSARITSRALRRCRDPHCHMNFANNTSVWLLYRAPPGSAGLTNGVRSVEARKSANHASAVAVRCANVASITCALAATRKGSTFANADADGSPSPQRFMSAPSSAKQRPIASTLAAIASVVTLRARAPCSFAAAAADSDAIHVSASASAGAAARGVRCGPRSAGAAIAGARSGWPAPRHTSLPHKGGGAGMPLALSGSKASSTHTPARAAGGA